MKNRKKIYVFWWSTIRLQGKEKENFGDIMSKYLVEKISGREVNWKHPKKLKFNIFRKKIYVTTGSILAQVTENCVVWGSGIISKKDKVKKANFLAVRGPETYKYLKGKGYDVPEIFGDPAILLPNYYNPKIDKKFDYGIVPHYEDFEKVNNWYSNHPNIKVVDLMNNYVESVINDMLECKNVISSSLHGIIVSHTYGIPAIWVKFSDKLFGDNIKFSDYFQSVNLTTYTPKYIADKVDLSFIENLFNQEEVIPKEETINKLRINLLEACPFKS